MAIKKKGSSNLNTKGIKKPAEESNNDLKSAEGKQTIVTSSGNLRVTGETVTGIPDTASVTIQCTISEDNYDSVDGGNNPTLPSFESDTDGFVVKRLLKEQQLQESTAKQQLQDIPAVPAATYYNNSSVRAPPTAPRSSPINDLHQQSYM